MCEKNIRILSTFNWRCSCDQLMQFHIVSDSNFHRFPADSIHKTIYTILPIQHLQSLDEPCGNRIPSLLHGCRRTSVARSSWAEGCLKMEKQPPSCQFQGEVMINHEVWAYPICTATCFWMVNPYHPHQLYKRVL